MDNITLDITFQSDNAEIQAKQFKHYIEKQWIPDLEKIEVNRSEYKDGQMGVGEILGSVGVLIKAANEPLTELAKALRDYVKNKRTVATLKVGDKTMEISGEGQKVEEIVKLFLSSPEGSKTTDTK
ncbi:hypothetical protein GXP67_19590 [Rhodocytophaga rosea]|uniref:Uncharacterized protein n=1 Tax=Rhodocytophaga rosea TaxID=2704465 RepID=A0A6C0GL36_9BACT|nr:hypothetical protein [Rhodocytophaga rosea]QHT68689.1 hypothetical protein GXP67_19590 [Rhodocytophaga rosea]